MGKTFHILNGDALMSRFPSAFQGDVIVFRECLVDGDVSGESDEEFYQNRASFISRSYGEFTPESYFEMTVPELEKIKDIPKQSTVNLWFEDDLFCQVNCWYVLDRLKGQDHQGKIYLVRPFTSLEYGFAGLDEQGLISNFERRQELKNSELDVLGKLWKAYQYKNDNELLKIANESINFADFLKPSVNAEIDRKSSEGELGRPEKSLLKIMEDLDTRDFGPVFQEFCKRESIYGFGDLQVMKLWRKLTEST
ncbi:DUF1835 domain-containing protein [Echinicola sp. CAU 1574]|uniref:DUF1835 domain-containing protein n=1 Tax=Echinicola arenosa TaxID=2774144 RepID=A0ABR9ALT0_9BACT|nr:DUF1835 domain-containing protein [Echinicola arenosa]MBD8488855.1 DUF1835 domain-containing protein [Echinicola arenosa]